MYDRLPPLSLGSPEELEARCERGIVFGALAPKIEEQGFSDVGGWQQDADALNRLKIRGLLTYSQVALAEWKLAKKVIAHNRKLAKDAKEAARG